MSEERYSEFIEGNPLITSEEDKINLIYLLQLRESNKRGFSGFFKGKEHRKYLDWINSKTPLLQDGKYTIVTKIYWIAHGLTSFPLCHICHQNELKYNVGFEIGYIHACSLNCSASNPERQEKTRRTMQRNYGVDNYFQSKEGKAKRQAWLDERGISNAFQDEDIKKFSRQTRKEHFGYEYTMQSPEKRELTSKNYEEKTGYKHQFQNPEVIEKANSTKQKKRESGVDLYERARISNRKKRYEQMMNNDEVIPNFSLEDFIKLNNIQQYITYLNWHCKKCNSDFEAYLDQNFSSRFGIQARCLKCHPFIAGISSQEVEMKRFISEELKIKSQMNTKKIISPLELDLYAPSFNIAFEFDGLFWHSERSQDDNFDQYHLAKTQMCESKGINLIHVFEDEWLEKNNIVKSRIKNLFGIYDEVVFARKCEVREISSKESLTFQDENHIQGKTKSKVNVGLFYRDQLVSLMTFGRSRFDKSIEWEMLRFCNKLSYHIPGAAGKLLKYFERNYKPTSLISYADRRWSQGKLYRALGFKLVRTSAPNYWYCKDQKRFSRIKFQKHKLKDLLQKFDPNKTEVENMKNNGYYRIFDCGNLVFVKEYKNKSR